MRTTLIALLTAAVLFAASTARAEHVKSVTQTKVDAKVIVYTVEYDGKLTSEKLLSAKMFLLEKLAESGYELDGKYTATINNTTNTAVVKLGYKKKTGGTVVTSFKRTGADKKTSGYEVSFTGPRNDSLDQILAETSGRTDTAVRGWTDGKSYKKVTVSAVYDTSVASKTTVSLSYRGGIFGGLTPAPFESPDCVEINKK